MEKAQEEKVGQMISNLIKYIPEDQRKDLEKLFAYWEKMK